MVLLIAIKHTPLLSASQVNQERQGLLVRDAAHSYLSCDAMEEGPMDQLLGSSITYRIAMGPCCEAVSSQMSKSRSDTN